MKARIRELGRVQVITVPQMVDSHTWLDGKRFARRSVCYQNKVTQVLGQAPNIPEVYWQCPENLSVSGLFPGLLDAVSGD